MAKSKKNRQQDFQKVKLKIGKKLPKGQNVTNASFRSASIVLKEQLKAHASASRQDSSAKKYDIKYLLSQVQHFSVASRHAALLALKEAIHSDTTLLCENLSVILEKICPLYVDKDQAVRLAVFKLLQEASTKIPPNQMSPFFPLMSAHLTCNMTHIDENIRYDSLNIFDIYLEYYPDILTKSSSNIVQNFMDQIATSKPGQEGKVLFIDPQSQFSSTKWRGSVLGRLEAYFEAWSKSVIKDSSFESAPYQEIQMNQDKLTSFQFYRIQQYQPGSGFRLSAVKRDGDSSGVKETVFDSVKSYIMSLTPLLLQCWTEAVPRKDGSEIAGNTLSVGSWPIAVSILRIVQLLLSCLNSITVDNEIDKIDVLKHKSGQALIKHITDSFPVVSRPFYGKRKRGQNKDFSQSSCFTINLLICDIVLQLFKMKAMKYKSANDDLVYSFVVDYLTQSVRSGIEGQYRDQVAKLCAMVIDNSTILKSEKIVKDDGLKVGQPTDKPQEGSDNDYSVLVEFCRGQAGQASNMETA